VGDGDGMLMSSSSASIHNPLRPVYRCEFCLSFLDSKRSLQEHVNGIHFHQQAAHCKDCGKCFTWRAQLSRHRLTGACPHPNGRERGADVVGLALYTTPTEGASRGGFVYSEMTGETSDPRILKAERDEAGDEYVSNS